MHSRAE